MTAFIEVRGLPKPQGSKRAFVGRSGKAALVESAGEALKSWREAVRSEVAAAIKTGTARPRSGPVTLNVTFYLPRPRSHYRTGKHAHELRLDAPLRHDKRPDLDKLVRSTCDALTAAGLYGDDSQVSELVARKVYAGDFIGAVIHMDGGVE